MKQLTGIFLLLFVPALVLAHTTGYFYEAPAGPYIVDIGYSVPAPIEGEAVSFEFGLLTAARELAPFTSSWVRIENEQGATIYAAGLYNDPFGGPRMSYAFPSAGKYTVIARYDRGPEAIADASFPMTVLPSTEKDASPIPIVVYVIGGVELAVLVGLLLYVRRLRT